VTFIGSAVGCSAAAVGCSAAAVGCSTGGAAVGVVDAQEPSKMLEIRSIATNPKDFLTLIDASLAII
jgi:hypothetical protein